MKLTVLQTGAVTEWVFMNDVNGARLTVPASMSDPDLDVLVVRALGWVRSQSIQPGVAVMASQS